MKTSSYLDNFVQWVYIVNTLLTEHSELSNTFTTVHTINILFCWVLSVTDESLFFLSIHDIEMSHQAVPLNEFCLYIRK